LTGWFASWLCSGSSDISFSRAKERGGMEYRITKARARAAALLFRICEQPVRGVIAGSRFRFPRVLKFKSRISSFLYIQNNVPKHRYNTASIYLYPEIRVCVHTTPDVYEMFTEECVQKAVAVTAVHKTL